MINSLLLYLEWSGKEQKGFWTRIWHSMQNAAHILVEKLSLSGWLGLLASLAMGILALRYAYDSQVLAYQQVKLAEWTAKKDFLELCQSSEVRSRISIPVSLQS